MKILAANVGAFINTVVQQLRTGITDLAGVSINVEPGKIRVKFSAEVIQSAQSLSEVRTTAVPSKTSIQTPATTDVQTDATTDTTTRNATTTNSTNGENTDDLTYEWSDHE